MKTVYIYSAGSCDSLSRTGTAESLLECNGKAKYLVKQYTDTTANRCVIQGLIAGVESIKKPCSVLLVTSTPIGLKGAAQGKGINADLICTLFEALQERKCTFDFEVWSGRGEELRSKVVAGRLKLGGA